MRVGDRAEYQAARGELRQHRRHIVVHLEMMVARPLLVDALALPSTTPGPRPPICSMIVAV